MSVRLCVRPNVVVNDPFYDPTIPNPANRLRDQSWALRWLGEKYLCHKPINRRDIWQKPQPAQ